MKRILPGTLFGFALLAVYVLPAAAQGLPGATVRAEGGSGTSSAERDAMRERCKANPEQCREQAKARREERCKANPQRCEEMKAKMKQRHEDCKADPAKCQSERKARREEFCKANPQRCAEERARREKRREECKADPEKCRARTGGQMERK